MTTTETTDRPRTPTVAEAGFIGQSIAAQGGQAARAGRGRLRRRRQAARHGLRPLRPLAVRAREDRLDRRLASARALEGVYGTLTGDEVAIQTDPFFQIVAAARRPDQGLRARGRQASRHVGEPVAAVVRRDARARARRRRPGRGRVRAAARASSTRGGALDATRRSSTTTPARTSSGTGVYDWGDIDGALAEADHVVRSSELHFHRFSSTPLECSRRARRVRPGTGEWTLHSTTSCPASRAIMMAPALRVGHRQAALRHAGHRRRLRQQDLPRTRSSPPLPARAQARPAGAVDGVAHRPAHGELRTATSATFLDIEVAVQADGTMLGFKVPGARRLPAPSPATSRSAASSGRRSRPAATAGGTSGSTSRRSAPTSPRRRRTAATRGCSTSG